VADPGFGERAEREPKRGSWGGAPSGVHGQKIVFVAALSLNI